MTIVAERTPSDTGTAAEAERGASASELDPFEIGALLLVLGALTVLVWSLLGTTVALLALGTIAGGGALVAALVRPAAAMILIVVSEFSNAGEVIGVANFYTGSLVLGLLSALVALRDRELRARLRRVPLAPAVLLTCYLLSLLPAIYFAMVPVPVAASMTYLLKDSAVLVVVLLLGILVDRPWWIVAMIVMTLTVLATMTIINQVWLGAAPSTFGGFATVSQALGEAITTPRHSGPVSDSNFWGRDLILGLPLAYALAHRSMIAGRRLPQNGWLLSALLLLGGIYLTQSRGTQIAALAATVVWVIAAGPRVRRRALQVLPVLVLPILIPGVGNRLLNLDQAFQDAPSYAIDPSIVQRAAAQHIAAVIFQDRPLFGTGPGSFAWVLDLYASRTGDQLIGQTSAPHNLYLEIGSESGIVGLAGWAVLIGGMVVMATLSVLRLAGARQDGRLEAPTRALAAGVLAAVLGWSTASIFLHMAHLRPLLIVFALVGLVHTRTRAEAVDHSPTQIAATARATRGLHRGALIGMTTVLVTGAFVAILLISLSGRQFTAQAQFVLLPSPGTYETYAIDVRNRVPVLPAYAGMIQNGQPASDVKVDADPIRGVITLISAGATREDAEGRLNAAIARAPADLAKFRGDKQYTLVPLARSEVTVESTYPPRTISITTAAVVAELGLIALVVQQFRRRDRRAHS